jgi:radical SAM protein with 4Fe4S-binding SPASM domain
VKRSLLVDTQANSCYFRTSVGGDGRKALIQITERCNLHCAHCFVSSGNWGEHMSLDNIVERVLPRLMRARVERITLTGGEPFLHPSLLSICATIADQGVPLGICTNGTQTTIEQIEALASLGNVHINVSFDGFRAESHGRFRGDQPSFTRTVKATRQFTDAGLLQGLLSTPNTLASVDEFAELCEFAVEVGAEYVLMNPLSSFGRGVKSKKPLAADELTMRAIRAITERFSERGLELVHIRFPNDDKPLGGCDAGRLIYVFTDGSTAVCPYLVFAARTPQSTYSDAEFIVGNIFESDLESELDDYNFHQRFLVGDNSKCRSCGLNAQCGKGCPAALIANGQRIGDVDREQCPVPDDAALLPLVTVR